MTFNSIPFLILFIVTYISLKLVSNHERQLWILLIASYVFYAYWDIRFLGLMIFIEYISYWTAKNIERYEKNKRRYLWIGVTVSLFVLAVFKYLNFFIEQIEFVSGGNIAVHWKIVLPIGISFYTFQCLSYMVDVYRGEIKARKKFRDVSLYISFFPQLVAGPIVRAKNFLPQIDRKLNLTIENFNRGIQIFSWGLFKKVVVADRLAVCVDAVWTSPGSYSSMSIWCAVISYMLQILCDFSGYSDMAIGVAKIFGFDFPKNFDLPYLSGNPQDFWKRWHISLSEWLKDYLYIPLGGNRQGVVRTYINLMVTMLLGGLWHGASWNFLIWGGCHGTALVLHKIWKKRVKVETQIHDDIKKSSKIRIIFYNIICVFLTDFFVMICWIFFRTQRLSDIFVILYRMFIPSQGIAYIYTWSIIFVIGVVLFYIRAYRINGHIEYRYLDYTKTSHLFLFFMMLWLIGIFGFFGSNAFIYFQF